MNNWNRAFGIGLSLVLASTAWGQTPSVVNGGFESYSSAPTAPGQWYFAVQWGNAGSPTSDPDFFHEDGIGGGDLPETPVAMVPAFEGKGIMGFTAATADGSNRREYVVGQFAQPLVSGERYRMHFALTNGTLTAFSSAGIAVSGLGLVLSEAPLQQSGLAPLDEVPVFQLNQPVYDRDWMEVECTFTAGGAWTQFAFGVFATDDEVTFEVVEGGNPQIAYYFVDAFSIELAPDEAEEASTVRGPELPDTIDPIAEEAADWFVPNAFSPNGDGENETFSPVLNAAKLKRFEVYSRWGESLFMTKDAAVEWDGRDKQGNEVPMGMYVWQLEVQLESGGRQESSGMLTLIR